MKYQAIKINEDYSTEQVAILKAVNKVDAQAEMAELSKEKCIYLYLYHYDSNRPDFFDVVISLTTPAGVIMNY